MNMAGQVGSFSSTVAFGYIVSATGSWDAPLIPMSAAALVSAVLWLKIDASRRLEGASKAA
jgi:nitrate/nitrite transporter NarK